MQRHLFVLCEECGKKYRVDTAKIIGLAAGFSCRSCGHRILVARPPRQDGGSTADGMAGQRPVSDDDLPPGLSDTAAAGMPPARPARGAGASLRLTAVLLFFLLPGLITAAGGFFFWDQVEGMLDATHRQAALTLLMMVDGFILAALGISLLFGIRLTGRVR
jgi:DNA-directed RNA polymerase subunit RPC12/RpoP